MKKSHVCGVEEKLLKQKFVQKSLSALSPFINFSE